MIDLNKYGEGVKEYYFTFVAMELTPNFLEWVGASYVTKHQRLEIAVELPYDQLVVATPEATIKLMEAAYLQGIEKIGELNLKYPFDYKAFKADVAAIFSQEDWYHEEKFFN